jgi:predicted methyltransferase
MIAFFKSINSAENNELNVAYFNLVEFESNEAPTIKIDGIKEELEEIVQSVTVYESE